MMEDKEELGKENENEEDDLDTDLEQDLHDDEAQDATGADEDADSDAADDDGTPRLERNLGTQPIEDVMTTHSLKNHDVMQMNRGGLTHKMVQKARKGRRLKPGIKVRVTDALNAALRQKGEERQYAVKELFNY